MNNCLWNNKFEVLERWRRQAAYSGSLNYFLIFLEWGLCMWIILFKGTFKASKTSLSSKLHFSLKIIENASKNRLVVVTRGNVFFSCKLTFSTFRIPYRPKKTIFPNKNQENITWTFVLQFSESYLYFSTLKYEMSSSKSDRVVWFCSAFEPGPHTGLAFWSQEKKFVVYNSKVNLECRHK